MSDKELILNRNTNTITISEFFENHSLKKYNFAPSYQRRGDAWSLEKQSFLIDSIMKNYPIPPIFLHAKVNSENGKTVYDIIDGKQRLTSIVKFISNEIDLPENFGDDSYGSEEYNGLKFNEIDAKSELKSNFWKYKLPIEYVDTEDVIVVNNIFDRLNRNGEPLNNQELRHAKYNKTKLLETIQELSNIPFWKTRAQQYLDITRMEDDEFVSELVFAILENELFDSKPETLDKLYAKWDAKLASNPNLIEDLRDKFNVYTNYMQSLDLAYESLKIEGVSHLYGLWSFSMACANSEVPLSEIKSKVNEFFIELREKNFNEDSIKEYKNSMSYNTKSKGQRTRRLKALLQFCNINN
ncbi:DUF262 domain-containing protein [Paenibacillus xylanexedens]|uniref:Uncharacterized protein with ParB-like and HNH nuclease domain n=1 Tax=Paenibacillus xylanexedens TaxID=528191 RepID=A0ABS4RQM8_PAEXY|nr:DUF262 domain-containing protein [Paenibacillus xylanexedens]MBP2245188.1 uncharacterized protein with ParB-like and HNH nuclease domain [Paenibacillus xylanexedens]